MLQTMGMAVMLDVIINYVRSLQNQIDVCIDLFIMFLFHSEKLEQYLINSIKIFSNRGFFFLIVEVSFNETISSKFVL